MQQETLEDMDTPALDKRLQETLAKEDTDSNLVRRIAHVLEERDRDTSVELSPEVQALFDQFVRQGQRRTAKRSWGRSAAILITAVVAVFLMLMALPGEAQAGSWWDRIVQRSEEIFEFIRHRNASEERGEYKFQTDNPGLQEAYDAVSGLGVTDPVVPMWLPEGYVLEEIREIPLKTKTLEYARFVSGDKYITYKAYVYSTEDGCEYNIDEKNVVEHESAGVTHYIMQNNDKCVSVWTKKNVECSLTIDGSKDFMCEVLDSIYIERR